MRRHVASGHGVLRLHEFAKGVTVRLKLHETGRVERQLLLHLSARVADVADQAGISEDTRASVYHQLDRVDRAFEMR